jgi:hypothetical protein
MPGLGFKIWLKFSFPAIVDKPAGNSMRLSHSKASISTFSSFGRAEFSFIGKWKIEKCGVD